MAPPGEPEAAPLVELARPADAAPLDAMAALALPEAKLNTLEELGREVASLWVARWAPGGPPVGFLSAWNVADELHILHIGAAPSERRRGVGRALMRGAFDHARRQGTTLLVLEVRRSNTPAIRLYRAFGFFVSGLRRRYYSDGEDAVDMLAVLDPATGAATPAPDEFRIDDDAAQR